MTISELNRIITIRHIAIGQNERGMPLKIITAGQSTYAKKKKVSGGYGSQQGQTNFSSTYDFTVRHEPSRIVANNDIIEDAGERFTINDITPEDEGRIKWLIIRCTKDDHSGQISDTMDAKQEIHVTGDVTIGGAKYAHWTGSIIVFRDGLSFAVKRDGTAQNKQINYNMTTGLFTYPADMEPPTPTESTDIYFL